MSPEEGAKTWFYYLQVALEEISGELLLSILLYVSQASCVECTVCCGGKGMGHLRLGKGLTIPLYIIPLLSRCAEGRCGLPVHPRSLPGTFCLTECYERAEGLPRPS